ncbi:tripartite motif-containing protein 16-like [Takifugu rubripes]|uniref:tripartite motif-containing protein 16-like n=1 Tax=Takifugu rubripes TaxID=31033 RepID=UPI00114520DE|nr:tripartite motif-containing protein 16-like [Takifugu rubripes]
MSGEPSKEPDVILCDMCADNDRKPAQKTCMKCEIAMCGEHLKPHLTTPVLLQTHPLTEPVALGATTKCPQHGKLLEYYCLDDLTCVCVSCTIEDQHHLHNMKTFSTARKELKEKLVHEQRDLRTRTGGRDTSLEEWMKVETEKATRSGDQLVDAVKQLRDLALTSVQNSVSARMVSIKTSTGSLQAAQGETDTFRFLQMYSRVNQDVEKAKAVDLTRGLEPGVNRKTLVQQVSQYGVKMVAQAEHFWKSLVVLVDPEKRAEISSKEPTQTFELRIAGPCVTLSRDKRKIFYSKSLTQQNRASVFHIQDTDPKLRSSKLQKWVLSLSGDYDWTIGLCRSTYVGSNNNDAFGLSYIDKRLKCLTAGQCRDVSGLANLVGQQTYVVIWHQPDSLSFFSLTAQKQRKKVTSIQLDPSDNDLTPFVCLHVEKLQSQPVTYAGFNRTPQQSKPQWSCTCGRVYNLDNKCPRNCYCGKFISDQGITDLVCELL